jgi:hypothetical protein
MKFSTFIFLLLGFISASGQSDSLYTQNYLNKSSSFAWLTYGGDLNLLTGGKTQQLQNGSMETVNFGNTFVPRLTIGGVHFWGHADFYVTFPLTFATMQAMPEGFESIRVHQGVETGARIYPLKIKPNSIRPFAGISFRRIRFSQENQGSTFNNGVPEFGRFIYPIQFGLTYTSNKWHITASGYYNYQNTFDYFISPQNRASVELSPFSLNLSFLRYSDTDRNMRQKGSAGKMNSDHEALKAGNKLSTWFIGIGPSAALQTSKSPYLEKNFPFFYEDYASSIMPDFALGRYFYKTDLNVNLIYRGYSKRYEGFDASIKTQRQSIGLESVKFLFNYLGFVPFVGPVVSYESLSTSVNGTNFSESQWAFGFTFGWDIRVTRTGTSLLRTNLRYYPDLHMNIQGEKMMFDHLEFNFIQWVYFIGRNKALTK